MLILSFFLLFLFKRQNIKFFAVLHASFFGSHQISKKRLLCVDHSRSIKCNVIVGQLFDSIADLSCASVTEVRRLTVTAACVAIFWNIKGLIALICSPIFDVLSLWNRTINM